MYGMNKFKLADNFEWFFRETQTDFVQINLAYWCSSRGQSAFQSIQTYLNKYISDLNFPFQINVYCVAVKLVV